MAMACSASEFNLQKLIPMKIPKYLLLLIFCIIPIGMSAQSGPHWWYEYDVITGDPADDYAAVNQGQLKYFAYKAYEYLLDEIPGSSGPEWDALDDLIDSWANPGSGVDDFHAVNLGQLKYVISLFYDVLIEEGFAPGYPWARMGGSDDDYVMVNIGQVKNMFSFDLVYPQVVTLSGMLEVNVSQEVAGGFFKWIGQFGLPLAQQTFHATPANDGIPNLLKYAMGLDPTIASNASMPVAADFTHGGVEYFGIEFDRPQDVEAVTFHLEVNPNWSGWREVFGPVVVVEQDPNFAPGLAEGYERVWMSEWIPKSQLPGPVYLLRLRIRFQDVNMFNLLAPNPNMDILGIEFIGQRRQRTEFADGLGHGVEIDEGIVFSTGLGSDWDQQIRRGFLIGSPGDDDLLEWMHDEGIDEDDETFDASGFTLEFEPTFTGTGTLTIGGETGGFLFASNEYYQPYFFDNEAKNDGMAIFLFEVDENGIIASTRKNIGILPTTDTHSKAINVFNVGELFDPHICANIQYFRKNSVHSEHYGHPLECPGHVNLPAACDPNPPQSLSPCKLGYSGFTPKFVAEAEVEGGKRYLIKAVVADFGDRAHDSAMFIANWSIKCIQDE